VTSTAKAKAIKIGGRLIFAPRARDCSQKKDT
jgi:hypothetical protein